VFKFITHRPFWVNLVAAIVLAFLLVFIFLQLLSWITKHGEHLTVPDVRTKKTEEAIQFLKDKGFDVVVQDSVYTDTLPRGVVIKQLPDPNATVKVNRTVFLTVNRETLPMVEMPDLEGQTLNFALEIMRRNHLNLEDTVFQTGFMRGSVHTQEYRGSRILKGTKIPWGSGITLVVDSGLARINEVVPNLYRMKYGDVKPMLDSLGIITVLVPRPGEAISDTAQSYIWFQRPAYRDESNNPVYIKPGMIMDVFIQKDYPDSAQLNSTPK